MSRSLVFSLMVILAACKEPSPPVVTATTATQPSTSATSATTATAAPIPAAKFAITYPQDSAKVATNKIDLRGVGADPSATLKVDVYTDDSYPQDGRGIINADGSWTYQGCWLKGKSPHNNHTITVSLVKNGTVLTSTSVQGIVRDPE